MCVVTCLKYQFCVIDHYSFQKICNCCGFASVCWLLPLHLVIMHYSVSFRIFSHLSQMCRLNFFFRFSERPLFLRIQFRTMYRRKKSWNELFEQWNLHRWRWYNTLSVSIVLLSILLFSLYIHFRFYNLMYSCTVEPRLSGQLGTQACPQLRNCP